MCVNISSTKYVKRIDFWLKIYLVTKVVFYKTATDVVKVFSKPADPISKMFKDWKVSHEFKGISNNFVRTIGISKITLTSLKFLGFQWI